MEQRRVVKFKDGTILKGRWLRCGMLYIISQIAISEKLSKDERVESWYIEYRHIGGEMYA